MGIRCRAPTDQRRRHVDIAFNEDKGFVYWLGEQASRRTIGEGESIYHRRYVCAECVQALYLFIERVPRSTTVNDAKD